MASEQHNIPDKRALGLPDEPYSAYCRVCWQGVYGMWIEADSHGGVCPFGATRIGDCRQATEWEHFRGRVKSYLNVCRATRPAGERQ